MLQGRWQADYEVESSRLLRAISLRKSIDVLVLKRQLLWRHDTGLFSERVFPRPR